MSPIRRRRKRRAPRLNPWPASARCNRCGSPIGPFEDTSEGQLCYDCARQAEGRQGDELHHFLPKVLDRKTTIRVPGNFHRAIEAEKSKWPSVVLTNRDRKPLLMVITILLVIRDIARVLWEHYLPPSIDSLLKLNESLTREHGVPWEPELGLPETLWPMTGLNNEEPKNDSSG
jgi:hypothetical protein